MPDLPPESRSDDCKEIPRPENHLESDDRSGTGVTHGKCLTREQVRFAEAIGQALAETWRHESASVMETNGTAADQASY